MNKPVPNDGTVGKALEVLDLVASVGRPIRFSDLLKLSSHPKATLYRFLQTLTNQGMLSYDDQRQTYTLGIRLVRLAHTAWKQASLAPIARPHLDALAAQVSESVHLAQLESGHVLFVDKRKTTEGFETLAQPGKIAPGYCTGVGKAILAFMDETTRARALSQQVFLRYTPATHTKPETLATELAEIRKNGFAFDREEHEQGIISIAVPILSSANIVIGAVSIASSTSRHSLETLDNFRAPLRSTATAIGAEAETWQFPT